MATSRTRHEAVDHDRQQDWDVVVVGSGAGGLTAATVAALAGLKVLVIERTAMFGGTTALSGGGIWIPANHHMEKAGIRDTPDEARIYLKAVLGNDYDDEKIEAYLKNGPEMLRHLESNTDVAFTSTTLPDYSVDAPGRKVGRCLTSVEYDGRRIGPWFRSLRSPLPELGLFHSMQVNAGDAARLLNWRSSFSNIAFAVSRLGNYALDRVVAGRGRHLTNGNALVARLIRSSTEAGVTLWHSCRADRLLMSGDRVAGVVAIRNGVEEELRARRGIVLASGGFGANKEMRNRYIPQAEAGWSFQPDGCQGDGIRMGIDAGGLFNTENAANGIWVPASTAKRDDGSTAVFPSFAFDRHCPGSIFVDASAGRRFVNEACNYQAFGEVAREKGITKAWMISDSIAVAKYGIGMAKPAPFSPKPWVEKGYLIRAATIGELAKAIGLEPDRLGETIQRFNDFAELGQDPDFGRGADDYSAYMGDPFHKPNPSLGPLQKGPFYALEIRPCDLSTLAGLSTNAHAQVLRSTGDPIEGLYAVGLDNNNLFRGRYPGGGASIGPAMTFGYIAARRLAQQQYSPGKGCE